MKLNEIDINEIDGPLGDLKRWLDKSTHQSMYNKAADKMYKVLKRKEQENGGKWRHTLGYYAMQIGRSFANIDYKNLHKTFKDKYGDEFPTLITELRIDIPSGEGMGIPRKKMPQIKSSDYPEFIDYLADNGATFTKEVVPPQSLKPVQKEFSKQGVEKQIKKAAKGKPKKPVIASSDDYIMDGHHRWLVALNTKDNVDIYRVNKPGKELLDLLLAFPKVYFKDIYNEDDIVEAPLVAKQSHIFQVISTLADRKDNAPFPIKFYDGGTMDVKPSTAKRIIDLYYRAEDKLKAQIMKYLPTYNGFKEIAIAAGAVKESAGVGKITKQNSTADVKPGETERQAKKFFGGNGKPKPLGVKGATPHQAFNLGMTENMSVTGTQRGQEARKKKLQPGSEAWFKHWFGLPLMKREDFEQAKSEIIEYVQENFKDGKKPGRKGLAKRSGVDCSKPVGELRKIAKNSSGEKQRMAHWCANMKSGRKKS